jgi:predicted O-methyltransferase YrrM
VRFSRIFEDKGAGPVGLRSQESGVGRGVEWQSDDTFQMGDVSFRTGVVNRFKSSSNHFMLVKHPRMIVRYEALISTLHPRRIVELGICEGGSTAFFYLLARPERLVAVDVKSSPTAGLEAFVNKHGLQDRVHTHYGFDQADVSRLRQLVVNEFAREQIDLVVDDASHLLGPTRASFNVLFPLLRPGGVFVIEDWSAEHRLEVGLRALEQSDQTVRATLEEHVRSGRPAATPLSVLVFELVLASAYAPELFTEIVVADGWAHVVRGPEDADPETFDLSRVYSDAARALIGGAT